MDSVIRFHTFGCKVNTYDTGLLEKRLGQDFCEGLGSVAPVHVLNSCAVTAEATREALALARKLKRQQPESQVIVTGCAAQVDAQVFADCEQVDLVVANSHKKEIETILAQHLRLPGSVAKVHRSNIFEQQDLGVGGGVESHHTRSFLKIQDGCNSFCTYCVIPFARGKSRSLDIRTLVARVNELHESGVNEIVLTGIHIADYDDDGRDLADLVEALLRETKVPRFRLGSLEPLELNERLFDLFSDDRLCSHFHLSIQSADDQVLRQMKRRYLQADVIRILQRISSLPGECFVGMDVIAGFATETEEQFLNTYQTLSDLPWTRLHVFPYSERAGTFAVRLGDKVSLAVKKARARRLRELSQSRYLQSAQNQIGRVKSVVWLKQNADTTTPVSLSSKEARQLSLSRDFWHISVPTPLAPSRLRQGEGRVLVREVQSLANRELRLVGEALAW